MASGRPGAGADQPSFKTNVNRMKTKRWVEAKSYTYDGDDWGDADEYDEYDGYDDPPQPSGQPQLPVSPGRPPYAQDYRESRGSFSRGDETRTFSGPPGSGSPRINPIHTAYGTPPAPGSPMGRGSPLLGPTRSSMEGPRPGGPGPGAAMAHPAGARPFASADAQDRANSFGSQNGPPAPSFAQRRDFPQPAPLHASQQQQQQHSHPPQHLYQQQQQQQNVIRPPRKSSLSQDNAPAPSALGISTQPSVSAADEDAETTTSPTIIRPADIYKRLAQAREQERASQESPRPSLGDLEGSSDVQPPVEAPAALQAKKPAALNLASEQRPAMEATVSHASPATFTATQKAPVGPAAFTAAPGVGKASTSPQLPDFESGDSFGLDFSSGFQASSESQRRQSILAAQEAAKDDPTAREADIAKKTTELSHQPSQGFRSVVHQAFDEPISATTPSGSDLGRSDTTSTNAISPIISRNSSKGQPEAGGAKGGLNTNMMSIAEEMSRGGADEPSNSLHEGHRRSLDPPSTSGSPARGSKLEVRNNVTTPEKAELEAAQPQVEVERQRQRSASAAKAVGIQSVVESLSQKAQESSAQTSPTRAESPTKGRVRDLVDKAESASSSRRGSESSTTGQERAELIRPQIPGGWNSYTTNDVTPGESPAPLPAASRTDSFKPSSLPGAAVNPTLISGQGGSPPEPSKVIPDTSKNGLDLEPTTERRSLSGQSSPPEHKQQQQQQQKQLPSGGPAPLEAAKAAGAALAGSIAAAAGIDAAASHSRQSTDSANKGAQQAQYGTGQAYNPDAVRPAMAPHADSLASSILQTPKGFSPSTSTENVSGDYPAVAPLRQRVGGGPSAAVLPSADSIAPAAAEQLPMSTLDIEASPIDDDNDELSREIERQLSPNPPTGPGNESGHPPPPHQPDVAAGHTVVDGPAHAPSRPLRHRFSWEEGEEFDTFDSPASAPPKQAAAPPPASTSRAPKTFGSILGGGHMTQPKIEHQQPQQPPVVPAPTILSVQHPKQAQPSQTVQPPAPYQSSPAAAAAAPMQSQFTPNKGMVTTEVPDDPSPVIKPTNTSISNVQSQVVTVVPEADADEVEKEEIQQQHQHQHTVQSVPPTPLAKDSMPPTPVAKDSFRPGSAGSLPPSSPQEETALPAVQGARQVGQAPPPGNAPIPPFREILAMKSPEDRLRVFQNTQDTFYHMNTGLSDWMLVMGERHPEHKALLQSRGQFTTPTPGMPTTARPQQSSSNASPSASSSTFAGLRKPGTAAAPIINDAGTALKSAGRDTKKLAKDLFLKGKSKFATRDKASKVASLSKSSTSAPSQPQQTESYQQQHQSQPQTYQPYRPHGAAAAAAAAATATAAPTSNPAPVTQSDQNVSQVQHSYSRNVQADPPVSAAQADSSPPSIPNQQAYSPRSYHSPTNAQAMTSSSQALQPAPPNRGSNQQQRSEGPVAVTSTSTHNVESEKRSTVEDNKQLPPAPQGDGSMDESEHEASDPPAKPVSPLRQRLTVHHKDMKPFELSFPDDLLVPSIPDKFRQDSAEVPALPAMPAQFTAQVAAVASPQTTPKKNEFSASASTPTAGQDSVARSASTAKHSLDPGSSLDPNRAGLPSWLNFSTPPIGLTPTEPEFTGLAESQTASPVTAAKSGLPAAVAAKPPAEPSSLLSPLDAQHTKNSTDHHSGTLNVDARPDLEERPFSFIKFEDESPADLTLAEVKFEPKLSLDSSALTFSYEDSEDDYERDDRDDGTGQVSQSPVAATPGSKPLPDLPPLNKEVTTSPPQTNNNPVVTPTSAGPRPSLSLFPQTRSRSGTLDSPGADYGPPINKPNASATMPASGGQAARHKRTFSGGASQLLHRALTTLPGTGSPKREKQQQQQQQLPTDQEREREKAEKKKRRFSGLGFGNLIQQAKTTIRGGSSQNAPVVQNTQQYPQQYPQQYRPYTPQGNQGAAHRPGTGQSAQQPAYVAYTPQAARDSIQLPAGHRERADSHATVGSQSQRQNSDVQQVRQQPPKVAQQPQYPAQYSQDVRGLQGPVPSATPVNGHPGGPDYGFGGENTAYNNRPSLTGGSPTVLASRYNPYRSSTFATSPSKSGQSQSMSLKVADSSQRSRSKDSGGSGSGRSLEVPGIDSSPRIPSSQQSPNLSPPEQDFHPGHSRRPSRSNASVISRRARAPSLSIDTGISTASTTPRQPNHPNLRPDSQQKAAPAVNSGNRSMHSNKSPASNQESKRRPSQEPSRTGSDEHVIPQSQPRTDAKQPSNDSTGPSSQPVGATPGAVTQSTGQEQTNEYFEDDDCPSDLEALPGFNTEAEPASALTRGSEMGSTRASTIDILSPPMPPMPPMPGVPGSSSFVAAGSNAANGNGSNLAGRRAGNKNRHSNRITLTAAELRIARQREIELGGETGLNSPEATPESAGAGKRLGHTGDNVNIGMIIDKIGEEEARIAAATAKTTDIMSPDSGTIATSVPTAPSAITNETKPDVWKPNEYYPPEEPRKTSLNRAIRHGTIDSVELDAVGPTKGQIAATGQRSSAGSEVVGAKGDESLKGSKVAGIDDKPSQQQAPQAGAKKNSMEGPVGATRAGSSAAAAIAAAAAGAAAAVPSSTANTTTETTQQSPKEKAKTEQQRPGMLAPPNRRESADAVPVMSATSFPGQEWNPYAGF